MQGKGEYLTKNRGSKKHAIERDRRPECGWKREPTISRGQKNEILIEMQRERDKARAREYELES